ncbi:MAG: hypothetical protein WA116_10675 [Anaerolineaceae bacterium]
MAGLAVWVVLTYLRKFILKKTSQSGRETGMLHQFSLEFKGPTIFVLAVAAMTAFLNVSEGVTDVLRIILYQRGWLPNWFLAYLHSGKLAAEAIFRHP